jgi:hypothetical protein
LSAIASARLREFDQDDLDDVAAMVADASNT